MDVSLVNNGRKRMLWLDLEGDLAYPKTLDKVYELSKTTSAVIQGSGAHLHRVSFNSLISPQSSLACRILIDFFLFFPNSDKVLKYCT